MTLALNAIDIHLSYGNRCILRGVSATVRPGEIVGLVGANGAGKSSLMKVLAGLIKPNRGHVSLDGHLLEQMDRRELGRHIAYLPQDRAIHWPLSVRQLVSLGRIPHRNIIAGTSNLDADAIEDAMTAVGISKLADRSATELSGGERACMLLARALAQQAKFMIADEPSAGLDVAHELSLFAQLEAFAAKRCAVLIALHDLSLAARYCHRVYLMHSGLMLAEGEPSAVLTPARLAEGFGISAKIGRIDGLPVVVPLEPASLISSSRKDAARC